MLLTQHTRSAYSSLLKLKQTVVYQSEENSKADQNESALEQQVCVMLSLLGSNLKLEGPQVL